jgi:type II secretory pathway component PulF
MPIAQALELSGAKSRSKALRKAVVIAAKGTRDGLPLSESLGSVSRAFPHYVFPIIRAGESSGKVTEAWQLIRDHAMRVAPSVRLIRNTWLYPSVCILFGWIVRATMILYFGKHAAARDFVFASFGSALLGVSFCWLLYNTEPVRHLVDTLILQLPLIREAEIRIAVVLFFATFRLAYVAGGLSVINMFDLSLATIRNRAIRRDFAKAREALLRYDTFGDAFERVEVLESRIKGSINTGAIAGQLDVSLGRIVEDAKDRLEETLNMFNSIFQRIVSFCVAMSIVETVFLCLM